LLKTVDNSDNIELEIQRGAIIFYFYYFFEDLYYIPAIQQAFRKVGLDKMLSDGYFDMSAYQSFMQGKMQDYIPTDEELEQGFATLPQVDA